MTGYGGCASCEGRCCREYLVPVSGFDLVRLAGRTGLAPEEFVVLVRVEEVADGLPGGEGARLTGDGPLLSMVLDRREDEACVFLATMPTGRARCGVYDSRPLVCAVFPFEFRRGGVAPREDASCGTGSWNLATIDLAAKRAQVLRSEAEWAIHRIVIASWNELVAASHPRLFSPAELFGYLLAAYERIDELRAATGDFDRLVLAWGRADSAGFLRAVASMLDGWLGPGDG